MLITHGAHFSFSKKFLLLQIDKMYRQGTQAESGDSQRPPDPLNWKRFIDQQ
jgi:hypothetical protein